MGTHGVSTEKLIGRVAIVTGAARRLGRSIALELAARGADIVLHYGESRDEAAETAASIEKLGRRVTTVSADLRRPVEAAERIVAAGAQLGEADILVNSAAIFENASLIDTTEDLYDRHQDINLKAPFFLCQQFARQLPEDRPGHIVNLVDWRAARPPADYVAYTLSKAGLLAMTKGLALQLAPRVQVNAIAPGAILPKPGEELDHWQNVKLPAIPLGRTGHPEDIVHAAMYLLTSSFVTGNVLYITGGEELR